MGAFIYNPIYMLCSCYPFHQTGAFLRKPRGPLTWGMLSPPRPISLALRLSHVTRQIRWECDFTRDAKISGVTAAEAYLCRPQAVWVWFLKVHIIFMKSVSLSNKFCPHWNTMGDELHHSLFSFRRACVKELLKTCVKRHVEQFEQFYWHRDGLFYF